jgi:2-hydroxymuconate-semialdehyde hydrolase
MGFGRSGHPEAVIPGPGPWFELRVDAVFRLLEELQLGQVHVVGHSYGARVALEMLIRAPERVGRVVLVAPGGTPIKADLGKLTGFYESPTEQAMRTLVEAQMSRPDVPGLDEYVAERFAIASWPEVRHSFEAAMAPGRLAPVYDAPALAAISHRVLAVHGKDDPTISSAASHYLAEHLASSDLHLFAGCGHLLQFEVPRQLGALIHDFVLSG